MTTVSPEREITIPDVEGVLSNAFDFEITCDISLLRLSIDGYPPCQGDPAKWIAWRTQGCCGQGPKYRLVCDFCKTAYQNWQAHHAAILCSFCGAETEGFATFTPLKE